MRSMALEWTWNYERMQHMGYCYALTPVLKKLYTNKSPEMKEALTRHLEFFNTTSHVSTLILGINVAMEEKAAQIKDFNTNTINMVKASLMGPLAGIGDSFIWGTLRIIATGIGTSLALKGNILGPNFLFIFNVPHFLLKYYLLIKGQYHRGFIY